MTWPAFGISFLSCLVLIPILRWFSTRLGLVSKPREDRWHKQPIPILGGVGIFLAFTISLQVSGALGIIRLELWLIPGLMFLLGLFDDLRPINPATKLIFQFLAASSLILFGYVIEFFPWQVTNILLTIIWLVGITNAINLLDNMDGLAGGISLIAAGFISYFFWQSGDPILISFSLALAGSVLGFLVFNFPPARIFMGDSGSLFLGFSLAALAIAWQPRASNVFAVLGPPIMLFLLPILDTSLVIVTRILRGQSPTQGGSDHTSHRLVAFGLTERQAVLVLYAIALASGIAGSTLEALDYDLSLLMIPVLLVSSALFVAYLGRLRVAPADKQTGPSAITQWMVELTFKRRLLEVVLDFFLISLAYYLAFWTQHGFSLDDQVLTNFGRTLPVALGGVFVAYLLLGVYRGVWRYVGVEDLFRYLRAVVAGGVLTGISVYFLFPRDLISPVVFFLFFVFLFLGLAASRSSFRVLDRIYGRQVLADLQSNVLIYGAEDAGELTLLWILRNPDLGYRPVGFLDSDSLKWGREIHGVEVLGDVDKLEGILERQPVQGLIVTEDRDGDSPAIQQMIRLLGARGIWIRRLRLEFELVEDFNQQ